MTVYRAVSTPNYWKRAPIRKQVLRDGGIFYLVVFFAVGLTSIGSFITTIPQINIPAVYTPVVLATTSVAVTRVMLNIRSITVDEGVEWIVSVYINPGSSLDIHKALPDSEKLYRIDRKFRVEL